MEATRHKFTTLNSGRHVVVRAEVRIRVAEALRALRQPRTFRIKRAALSFPM